MKKLLFIILVCASFSGLAQVDTSILIKSQYVEFYNWDEGQDEYLLEGKDWLDMTIDPYDDFYLVEIGNDGEVEKSFVILISLFNIGNIGIYLMVVVLSYLSFSEICNLTNVKVKLQIYLPFFIIL